MIVENTSFQFFRPCASFRYFHLIEGHPIASLVDFDLKKVVLRAQTCFAFMGLFLKKSEKWIFRDSCWGKSGFRVSGVFLGVMFGTEKIGKAWN